MAAQMSDRNMASAYKFCYGRQSSIRMCIYTLLCSSAYFSSVAGAHAAKWQAPPHPEPEAILDDARADAHATRFEDALAKQLWFHKHALEYRPSLEGVRLSIALDDWYELGKKYPPAMNKLKEVRDGDAKLVAEHKGDVRDAFNDMLSINEQFGDEIATADVFLKLDKDAPSVAKNLYDLAQPSLLKAKQYAICGKYLEPDKAYAHLVELHGLDVEMANENELTAVEKQDRAEYAEKNFLNNSATLIGLLSLNGRKAEAEKIAQDVTAKSKDSSRDVVIAAALNGELSRPEH